MSSRKIPVVDLKEYEEKPQELREASEWGCFRLINHGVSSKLMGEMKGVAKELLDLPVEIKQRNENVIPGSGYMAPSQKSPLIEALGMFDISSVESLSSFSSILQLSTPQREITEKYAQAISILAIDLASKLAQCMGLVASYNFKGWPCQFKINKYTFTQETIGSPGVEIHTDSGFFTILQDDECLGGFEAMDHSTNTFVAVDPWPGTLLVNLGDMVVPWSNGRLHTLPHRVICKDVGLRYSIATILAPPLDKVLEAPSEFVDDEHPRLYSSFTYEEYRNLRSSKNLFAGETLELIRME